MSQRLTIAAALALALGAPLAAATFEQQAFATYVEQQPFAAQSAGGRPTAVTPAATPQEQPTPRPGQGSGPSLESLGMRGFSVALVVGEMTGTPTADSLPAGARKAITDMRDFLPYKNYRMLDASWTLCCAGRAGGTSGRLRGLEEDEYQFSVWVTGVSNNKMSISFQLREVTQSPEEAVSHTASSAYRERVIAQAQREIELAQTLEADLAKRKYAENHPDRVGARQRVDTARRRVEEVERAERAERGVETARRPVTPRSNRHILDSTFSMEVGETVVIGTSRLKGDKALIALLTAASRTGASNR